MLGTRNHVRLILNLISNKKLLKARNRCKRSLNQKKYVSSTIFSTFCIIFLKRREKIKIQEKNTRGIIITIISSKYIIKLLVYCTMSVVGLVARRKMSV